MSSCRNMLHGSQKAVFEIIEMSIAVAAADCPDELVRRRDGIMKLLYSFPSVAYAADRPEEEEEKEQHQPAAREGAKKEGSDAGRQVGAVAPSCCSGDGSQKSFLEEADELQDALDDAHALLDEVLRLKKILGNKNEEHESSLFESLRRLQLMELTVTTLAATDIENGVRGVEGHRSTRVQELARVLLDGWAELRGDSSNVAEAVDADTPDAAADLSDDPWLNFPPLDEGALSAVYGPPIDLDKLLDENPRKTVKFKRDSVMRADEACEEKRQQEDDSETLKLDCLQDSTGGKRKREDAVDQLETPSRSAEPLTKRGKTFNASSKRSGKDLKRCAEMMKKDYCELANEPSTVTKMTRQQCPTDELFFEAKLEASRMQIREGYDRAKDEKQQRRIQLLDLCDIPKPVDSMKSCKSMARRDRGFINRWRR